MLTTWVFQTVQGSAKELKNHIAAFKSIQQIYSTKLYLCARDLHSLNVTKIWNRLWHRFVCMAFQPGSVPVRPQHREYRTNKFSSWIIRVLIIRVLTRNSIHFCPQRLWHWHFSDLGGDFSLAANWNVHKHDIMPTLWKKRWEAERGIPNIPVHSAHFIFLATAHQAQILF